MAERRRRRGRVLLIVLLVVIVLVVIADRVGVLVAQSQVANQAADQLAAQQITTSEKPSVSIKGFPFLTQVVAGNYGEIDINLKNPTSRGVRLDDLDVVATDVDAPTSSLMGSDPQITAKKVTGVAHIGWPAFEQLVDLSGLSQYGLDPRQLKIEPAGPGKIKVSGPVTILGAAFTAVATGTIVVRSGSVHVGIDTIRADGDNVAPAINDQLNQLKNQLTFDFKLPPLPYRLSVNSIATSQSGVVINASADNVKLAS